MFLIHFFFYDVCTICIVFVRRYILACILYLSVCLCLSVFCVSAYLICSLLGSSIFLKNTCKIYNGIALNRLTMCRDCIIACVLWCVVSVCEKPNLDVRKSSRSNESLKKLIGCSKMTLVPQIDCN